MATYLFAYNPKKWTWTDLDDAIEKTKSGAGYETDWSCGHNKSIETGSRFYLIQLGREPRGLIGTGVITTEPYEAKHWDPDHDGTSWRVNVRFDALRRAPVIRRPELDRPPFNAVHWNTQMSGVSIDDAVADSLGSLWHERLTSHGSERAHLSEDTIERWRELWEESQSDELWVERHRIRDEKRQAVIPQMQALLADFMNGEVGLEEFREVVDKRTRGDWDLFGLKGNSGAMFLNKLAKHLPDQDEVTARLQRCLAVPADEEASRAQLAGFRQYIEAQIDAGTTTRRKIQPARTSFLASAWWHIQDTASWPIFYQSARTALQLEGLIGKGLKTADGYVEFRRVFLALCDALKLEPWDVEHLCVWLKSAAAGGGEDPGPGEPPEVEDERVWLVAPGRGAELWEQFYEDGIIAIGWKGLGDLSQYDDADAILAALKEHGGGNPTTNARGCYQFANEMEVGDVIFAKKGTKEIVGYGIIDSEYGHEPERGSHPNVRSVDWRMKGSWSPGRNLVIKTITNIGKHPALVADIRAALGITPGETSIKTEAPVGDYGLEDAVRELFLDETKIKEALNLLRYKKNVVLQGPPGVGKTFFAKRLAYLLLGAKDKARFRQVQFHQSYAYEDFVQGYRPGESGNFERVDGPFLRFCEDALQDQESPYILMIDEINRGNLSKIFGELLLLIEADKRSPDWATWLAYSTKDDQPFHVPPNLYVIGTMNTADRSLAMIDYALRRRFAFVPIEPAFASKQFAAALAALDVDRELATQLEERLVALNKQIRDDPHLGDGFCIGHSYFCQVGSGQEADESWYEQIVRTEIEPLLREYWFDSKDTADEAVASLRGD